MCVKQLPPFHPSCPGLFSFVVFAYKSGGCYIFMLKQLKHIHNLIWLIEVYNISWRDVQRKNVVNNADMSSLRAPRQNDPYTEQHTNTRTLQLWQWYNNSIYEIPRSCWSHIYIVKSTSSLITGFSGTRLKAVATFMLVQFLHIFAYYLLTYNNHNQVQYT